MFSNKATDVPLWVWVDFIPQLLGCLRRGSQASVCAKAVLFSLAQRYPQVRSVARFHCVWNWTHVQQALYYPLREALLRARTAHKTGDPLLADVVDEAAAAAATATAAAAAAAAAPSASATPTPPVNASPADAGQGGPTPMQVDPSPAATPAAAPAAAAAAPSPAVSTPAATAPAETGPPPPPPLRSSSYVQVRCCERRSGTGVHAQQSLEEVLRYLKRAHSRFYTEVGVLIGELQSALAPTQAEMLYVCLYETLMQCYPVRSFCFLVLLPTASL
jgi:hypothetical protein